MKEVDVAFSFVRSGGPTKLAAMDDIQRVILHHAVALVAEHGVRGVSFREVARRAGVSHQAPYHHFKNLQGILDAISNEGFEMLAAAMQKAAAHDDPLEALNGIGVAYVRFATGHVGYFRVMFRRSSVEGPTAELKGPKSKSAYQTLVDCTQRVIDAGYGTFLEPEALAHHAWSSVHGLATLIVEGKLQRNTKKEVQAEARRMVEVLTSLLVRTKPPRRRKA